MKILYRSTICLLVLAIFVMGLLGTNMEAYASRMLLEFKRESDTIFLFVIVIAILFLTLSFVITRWSESREAEINRKKADLLVANHAPSRINRRLEKYRNQR